MDLLTYGKKGGFLNLVSYSDEHWKMVSMQIKKRRFSLIEMRVTGIKKLLRIYWEKR